jgi:dCMP deaminase
MCFLVSQRSIDPSTKCGAVLVSADRRVLSTGYNGPIKGSNDSVIPLTRPDKYAHFIHAEENCILAYSGSKQDLEGAIMYVTGNPCHRCLRDILQKGIKKIVVSSNPTVMHDEKENAICEFMLGYSSGVEYKQLSNVKNVLDLLDQTKSYIISKNPTINN